MPTLRNITQPAEIAAALASMTDMVDKLRCFTRDPELLAEIDRRVYGSAALLSGAPYLDPRHVTENVRNIMAEVDAGQRRPSGRAAR